MKDIYVFCSECKNETDPVFLGIVGELDGKLAVGYKYICRKCNREVAVMYANAEKVQFAVIDAIIEVIK